MGIEEILHQFSRYANAEASLREFEEWIISHVQSVLDSGNQEAISLLDQADALLIELGDGRMSEADFMERIAGLIRTAETIEKSFLEERPAITHESGESLFRNVNLTGLEEIRFGHVFG